MMYELILKDYDGYDDESFFYESEREYDSEEFFDIILEAIHTTSELIESNKKLKKLIMGELGASYNVYDIVVRKEFSEELKKYDIHIANFQTHELSDSFDSVEKVLKKYKYVNKKEIIKTITNLFKKTKNEPHMGGKLISSKIFNNYILIESEKTMDTNMINTIKETLNNINDINKVHLTGSNKNMSLLIYEMEFYYE